jgi:surface-anchored protein
MPARLATLSFLLAATATAQDIQVLVSNTANASAHHPAVGTGYAVRPAPHVDLNVLWEAATQTFTGGFRTDDEPGAAPVQYGPEDALAYLPPTGQRQRTSTRSQFDFQGALGDTYWVFPSSASASNNAATLYLGFSAYGVPRDGTFANDRINWTVHSVENLTTPEATSFHGYSISAGSVNMQLTLDPAYPDREMVMLANGHTHLNLLFKAPGMYRITFRVRGTLAASSEEVSGLLPVHFGIEEWEIPPATIVYGAWRLAEFSEPQTEDPLVSGPNADPDGDGFANLLEYAFGGDPLVPDAPLLQPRVDIAGGQWRLRFRQRQDASDLVFTIESTPSLAEESAAWSTEGISPTGESLPVDAPPNVDEVVFEADLPPGGQAFQRIRVQLAP